MNWLKEKIREWLGIDDLGFLTSQAINNQSKITDLRIDALKKETFAGIKKVSDYVGYVDNDEWISYGGPR